MSPVTIKEMTDDEIQWHNQDDEIQWHEHEKWDKWHKSRLLRLSRSRTESREIRTNFSAVFEKLYKMSNGFKNAIDRLPTTDKLLQFSISTHNFHNILLKWNRYKSFQKTGSRAFLKTFALLVALSKKLNSEYETDIFLTNWKIDENDPNPLLVFIDSRSNPIISLYRVEGSTIKRIEPHYEETSTDDTEAFSRPDRILITDLNSPPYECGNVLTDAFAGMSRFTPTVVGYKNREGNRQLLISLPEYLNPITLKEYARDLTKLHRSFYGKSYKGRPKGMSKQLTLMERIWMDKCKGNKKMSANQQAKILSEELMNKHDINLEPITIIRWYLPRLRKKNDKK